MNLSDKKCIPCEAGGTALTQKEVAFYAKDVPRWTIADNSRKIMRKFDLEDFQSSLKFVNRIGELAESEGHHPDIIINYNKVAITINIPCEKF